MIGGGSKKNSITSYGNGDALFLSCDGDLEQGGDVGNDDIAAHPVSPFPRSRVASPSSLAECDRPFPALVPEERRRLSSCPDFGNGLDCWL